MPKFNKPEGTSEPDFQKMKTQMTGIFESAEGIASLRRKTMRARLQILSLPLTPIP